MKQNIQDEICDGPIWFKFPFISIWLTCKSFNWIYIQLQMFLGHLVTFKARSLRTELITASDHTRKLLPSPLSGHRQPAAFADEQISSCVVKPKGLLLFQTPKAARYLLPGILCLPPAPAET